MRPARPQRLDEDEQPAGRRGTDCSRSLRTDMVPRHETRRRRATQPRTRPPRRVAPTAHPAALPSARRGQRHHPRRHLGACAPRHRPAGRRRGTRPGRPPRRTRPALPHPLTPPALSAARDVGAARPSTALRPLRSQPTGRRAQPSNRGNNNPPPPTAFVVAPPDCRSTVAPQWPGRVGDAAVIGLGVTPEAEADLALNLVEIGYIAEDGAEWRCSIPGARSRRNAGG